MDRSPALAKVGGNSVAIVSAWAGAWALAGSCQVPMMTARSTVIASKVLIGFVVKLIMTTKGPRTSKDKDRNERDCGCELVVAKMLEKRDAPPDGEGL